MFGIAFVLWCIFLEFTFKYGFNFSFTNGSTLLFATTPMKWSDSYGTCYHATTTRICDTSNAMLLIFAMLALANAGNPRIEVDETIFMTQSEVSPKFLRNICFFYERTFSNQINLLIGCWG